MPASQTDQLMLWRDGQSHTGGPDKKKKMPRDDSETAAQPLFQLWVRCARQGFSCQV